MRVAGQVVTFETNTGERKRNDIINPHLMRLRNLTAAAAVILSCLGQAAAQDELTPPKVEVKATFGGAAFDETSHTVFGGSARFYVTRRLSVEPEFLYLRNSSNDRTTSFSRTLRLIY
jgi:hypothetical protein